MAFPQLSADLSVEVDSEVREHNVKSRMPAYDGSRACPLTALLEPIYLPSKVHHFHLQFMDTDRYENGRRYHAYREGAYLMPNDAEEQERLDLSHHIFRFILDGALFRAPLGPDIKRVLDVGTGTGIWAIDFGDEYPNAHVIGSDLSPIQPNWLPPNLKFYVDDVESEWTWMPHEAFDFIHARCLGGSIAGWPQLYQRIRHHLKPGGWLELQEYQTWIHSDDDPELKQAPHTKRWQQLVNDASVQFGKKLNVAEELKQSLVEAGFQDVREEIVKVPIGSWAKNPKLKEIGKFQRHHMLIFIAALTLAPLTRILGWSNQEVQVLMAGVREELRNPKLHLLTIFHFVCGRQPMR